MSCGHTTSCCLECGECRECAEEAPALRARNKVLEGHRDQWRRIAFRLYDIAKLHDQPGADAVFEDVDALQTSGGEK